MIRFFQDDFVFGLEKMISQRLPLGYFLLQYDFVDLPDAGDGAALREAMQEFYRTVLLCKQTRPHGTLVYIGITGLRFEESSDSQFLDEARIDCLTQIFDAVLDAIEAGAPLQGIFLEPDIFYPVSDGSLRKSAIWFRQVAAQKILISANAVNMINLDESR